MDSTIESGTFPPDDSAQNKSLLPLGKNGGRETRRGSKDSSESKRTSCDCADDKATWEKDERNQHSQGRSERQCSKRKRRFYSAKVIRKMRRTRGEGCMVQNCVMETVTAKYSTVNGTLYSLPENKIRAMYWICACIPDIELRRKYICTVMSTKQACFLKVCERHFVERRPTENNPYPTLHLPDHVKALETPLTFCAIKGCHIIKGTKEEISQETGLPISFHLLPQTGDQRNSFFSLCLHGYSTFPTNCNERIAICGQHFGDGTDTSSGIVHSLFKEKITVSDTDSSADSECGAPTSLIHLDRETLLKRDMTRQILQRRPMFKCLVRCCPVTNHLVKPNSTLPYFFYDLPSLPSIRKRWLSEFLRHDAAFVFPPPLVGCGKYAVCERHFSRIPPSHKKRFIPTMPTVLPCINLTPSEASNLPVDETGNAQFSNIFKVSKLCRVTSNVGPESLKREMKILSSSWCCREVGEIRRTISRISVKIDKLYKCLADLCRIKNIPMPVETNFDQEEDDRKWGRDVIGHLKVNRAELAALQKALEGLEGLSRLSALDRNKSDYMYDPTARNRSELKTGSRLSDASSNSASEKTSPTRIKIPDLKSTFYQQTESLNDFDINAINRDIHKMDHFAPSRVTVKVVDEKQTCEVDSTSAKQLECSMTVLGGNDMSDKNSCSEHRSISSLPRTIESVDIHDTNPSDDDSDSNEIAPSLSPHVEDGPPLLFSQVDHVI